MKKLMSLMLVALLVCSLFSMGASAESISPVSDEAAYAKYFPEGVPDYLNDEQIQQVLNGQYLSVVVNDEIITYNPENNPAYAIGQTRAGQTVWDEDLTKNHTWWPELGSKYIEASCSITGNSAVSYLEFAYRNLRTNWNVSIKVK